MTRVNKAVPARRRHKKVLKRAKGYRGARSRTFKAASQAVTRAEQYAYRDRRQRKREFRRLWIVRLNAACRRRGVSYSRFMHALKQSQIDLDRKILAQIAFEDGTSFDALIDRVIG